jgi:hypothetical protein
VAGGDSVPWDESVLEEQEDIKPDLEQLQLQMLENMNQAQKKIQSSLRTPVAYPDLTGDTTDEGKNKPLCHSDKQYANIYLI